MECDADGDCNCKVGFGGSKCDVCEPNFFNYPSCQGLPQQEHSKKYILFSVSECNCNSNGSTTLQCDADGDCACIGGFDGKTCDICKERLTGSKCNECEPNHFGYPSCQGLSEKVVFEKSN